MKPFFVRMFGFILDRFEKGNEAYAYRPSSRLILKVVGLLFFGLSAGLLFITLSQGKLTAIIPIVVFSAVGSVCMVVGFLGSDRAVATLWSSAGKKEIDKGK